MSKPRIKIINHYGARDAIEPTQEEGESGNLPFAKRHEISEALSYAKRAVGIIPGDVATTAQLQSARRAVANAQKELAVASKLLGSE